jgi:Protein of unknown function (DUF2934)
MRYGNCGAMQYVEYVQVREESIATLARVRWLLRGCPEGSPEVDWLAAELDFDQRFVAQLELGIPA